MALLEQYGIFLLEVLTIVMAVIAIITVIASKAQEAKGKMEKGELKIHKINDDFDEAKAKIQEAIQPKEELKALKKALKLEKKAEKKSGPKETNKRKRLFLLDFNGDIKASAVDSLREEINVILLSATIDDEVLIRLESPGGLVNAYGLAASQLHRIRQAKIPLTIAIDKVAASGGYMMACVANHIISAPFAIIGSIGVVAQLPNFNRWLKKHEVDYEQITAGQYKRTLTVFGENDAKGREKMQTQINETHDLFKDFIREHREKVDLNQVATGEYWYGKQAIDFKLVDALQTSDDYLLTANEHCDIYHVRYVKKVAPMKKFFQKVESTWLQWQTRSHTEESFL